MTEVKTAVFLCSEALRMCHNTQATLWSLFVYVCVCVYYSSARLYNEPHMFIVTWDSRSVAMTTKTLQFFNFYSLYFCHVPIGFGNASDECTFYS